MSSLWGQGQGEMGGVSASVRADFKCGECKYTCLIGMRERPKMPWTLTKEWILAASIRRWNAMCNGDRKYKLIRESLGGRR